MHFIHFIMTIVPFSRKFEPRLQCHTFFFWASDFTIEFPHLSVFLHAWHYWNPEGCYSSEFFRCEKSSVAFLMKCRILEQLLECHIGKYIFQCWIFGPWYAHHHQQTVKYTCFSVALSTHHFISTVKNLKNVHLNFSPNPKFSMINEEWMRFHIQSVRPAKLVFVVHKRMCRQRVQLGQHYSTL